MGGYPSAEDGSQYQSPENGAGPQLLQAASPPLPQQMSLSPRQMQQHHSLSPRPGSSQGEHSTARDG